MEKKFIDGFPYINHSKEGFDNTTMLSRSNQFYQFMNQRRTVREFSDHPFPIEVIYTIIQTASSAPSGAHKQPWTFCVVKDPIIKKKIREAAEEEEKLSYESRMSEEWKQDLAPLGTDWQKPFLEIAPYLIIVFKRSYEIDIHGNKHQNYYVTESCGIACGFLLSAIHNAGLGALTHTPSPMNFLSKLLNRPENEKPFLLIPVGKVALDCWVPDIERKKINEIMIEY